MGNQLAELRAELEVTQTALASAAGINQSHVSRLERGIGAGSLDTLVALAAALGADVGVRLFPTSGPRLRDHLQAPMIEAVVRSLDPRWIATPELPVPAARGVIDLVLRLRTGEVVIACEAHSELRSIERVVRRLAEKTVALSEQVGGGARASSMLLVRSTSTTRAVARAYEATLQAAFPGSCRQALQSLNGAKGQWPGPTLLWATVAGGRASLMQRPARHVRIGREGSGAVSAGRSVSAE